jgi:hypothetical protein
MKCTIFWLVYQEGRRVGWLVWLWLKNNHEGISYIIAGTWCTHQNPVQKRDYLFHPLIETLGVAWSPILSLMRCITSGSWKLWQDREILWSLKIGLLVTRFPWLTEGNKFIRKRKVFQAWRRLWFLMIVCSSRSPLQFVAGYKSLSI